MLDGTATMAASEQHTQAVLALPLQNDDAHHLFEVLTKAIGKAHQDFAEVVKRSRRVGQITLQVKTV